MTMMKYVRLAVTVSAITLSGCANRVAYEEETLPEDLAVVDTNVTDEAPPSLDGQEGVDSLASEAPTDIPAPPASGESLVDGLVATEPVAGETAPESFSEPVAPVAQETFTAPAPMAGSAGMDGEQEYVVQRGDTLMRIAYLCYSDLYQWRKIVDDNRDILAQSGALRVGMRLKVDRAPEEDDFTGYERYLIKNGDTLGIIAKDVYGAQSKWKKLWKQNSRLIKNPNRIYAGFVLRYSLSTDEQQLNQELKQPPQILGSEGDLSPRVPSSNPASEQQAGGPEVGTPTF